VGLIFFNNRKAEITYQSIISGLWPQETCSFKLSSGESHLWIIEDSGFQPCMLDILSKDEQQRAQRLSHQALCNRYIVNRFSLRQLLSRYIPIEPHQHSFTYNLKNKPFLKNNPRLKFNVSHTQNLSLIGIVRDYDIGVDIEHLRKVDSSSSIMNKIPITLNSEQFGSNPKSTGKNPFFEAWTCYEAWVKALGVDIFTAQEDMLGSISLAPYTFICLYPQPDYIASIAVKGPLSQIKAFKFHYQA